ncbi:MAG: hypothetical protein LBS49_10750, partial [Candidatus Accumulibacter sp.]|nr:hypothetical protein [Accumulibacter sp.]
MYVHAQSKQHAENSKHRPSTETLARLWQEHLPPEYRTRVVAPLDIHRYRDHEIAAERYVGYDKDGNPCFTAYRFGFFEPR